jgi:hypothetical protein
MEDLGAAGAEDFDDEDDWTLLLVNAIASAFFAGSVAIAITIAIERLVLCEFINRPFLILTPDNICARVEHSVAFLGTFFACYSATNKKY